MFTGLRERCKRDSLKPEKLTVTTKTPTRDLGLRPAMQPLSYDVAVIPRASRECSTFSSDSSEFEAVDNYNRHHVPTVYKMYSIRFLLTNFHSLLEYRSMVFLIEIFVSMCVCFFACLLLCV